MKTKRLRNGFAVTVDDADWGLLSGKDWQAIRISGYLRVALLYKRKQRYTMLHHTVFRRAHPSKASRKIPITFIDGDAMNCTRANIQPKSAKFRSGHAKSNAVAVLGADIPADATPTTLHLCPEYPGGATLSYRACILRKIKRKGTTPLLKGLAQYPVCDRCEIARLAIVRFGRMKSVLMDRHFGV